MPSRRAPRTDVVTCRLRIELEDVSPPIWREFLVPSNLPLDQLHPVLQGVMGCLDSHMHSWVGGEPPLAERYVMRESLEDSFDVDDEVCDDAVRVDQVLSEVGDQLSYEYDFGDGWGHTILLEEITDGPAVVPSCIAGARACPPEDSGGPLGYMELLNVLADPGHPEHHGMRLWVGPSFSPERFDVESVNADLRAQNNLFMHGPVTDSKFAELLSRMSTHAAPQVFSLLGPAELTNPGRDLTEAIEKATAHLITAREATWVASPTVEYIEMVGAIVRNYRTPDVPTDPEWGRVFPTMLLSMWLRRRRCPGTLGA